MPSKLTKKQYQAAKMVAMGEMPEDIEATLNMRRHTLERWQRLDLFQRAVSGHIKAMQIALPLKMHSMQYLSFSKLYKTTDRQTYLHNDDAMESMKMMEIAKKLLQELKYDHYNIDAGSDLDNAEIRIDAAQIKLDSAET